MKENIIFIKVKGVTVTTLPMENKLCMAHCMFQSVLDHESEKKIERLDDQTDRTCKIYAQPWQLVSYV